MPLESCLFTSSLGRKLSRWLFQDLTMQNRLCITKVSSNLHPHECVAIPEDRYTGNNLNIVEGMVMFARFAGKEEIKESPDGIKVGSALGTKVVFHEINRKKLRMPEQKHASNSAISGFRQFQVKGVLAVAVQLEVVVSVKEQRLVWVANLVTAADGLRISDSGIMAHPTLFLEVT